MSLAVIHSRSLDGLAAPEVTVEVHLANGLPSFTLVGLADSEVKESRERVRAALQTSGLEFPSNKRPSRSISRRPICPRLFFLNRDSNPRTGIQTAKSAP